MKKKRPAVQGRGFVESVAMIGALFARAGGRSQAYRVEGEGVTVVLKRTL